MAKASRNNKVVRRVSHTRMTTRATIFLSAVNAAAPLNHENTERCGVPSRVVPTPLGRSFKSPNLDSLPESIVETGSPTGTVAEIRTVYVPNVALQKNNINPAKYKFRT